MARALHFCALMRSLAALLVALVFLAAPGGADAAPLRTLHVATTGNDSADGSLATPWRTLQRAANLVRAGDQVIVRPGHYFLLACADSAAGIAESSETNNCRAATTSLIVR